MKQRVDVWLVEHKHFQSREQARRAIMAGEILINGKRIEKAGQLIETGASIPVRIQIGTGESYVSRGGHKLEKALKTFNIDVQGKICLDAGASTGGFTDCLLQAGAAHVYAIDVGYGQLAWKLRQDHRVSVFERENIRYFEAHRLEHHPQLITADLAFISLGLIFPKFKELMTVDGGLGLITLIKPQFEVGKGKVGKKGVVKDKGAHLEVIHELIPKALDCGWNLKAITFSPLLGPEGNIEYLGYWAVAGSKPDLDNPNINDQVIRMVVNEAWSAMIKT